MLINNLLGVPHEELMGLLNQANTDLTQLFQNHNIKKIDTILKTNQRVAEATGHIYLSYLQNIFNDLLRIYNFYSQQISQGVSQGATGA